MKSRKLWLSLALLGVTIVAASAIVLLRPFVAYSGRPVIRGEGTAFRYAGHVLDNGMMDIGVSVDLNDPKAMQVYREANAARGRALIARGEAKAIWVQVTFARPLPADEVRTLVEETGFQVESFLMVGHTSDGGKMCMILISPIGEDFPEELAKTLSWQEIETLVYDKGYVPPAVIDDPMAPATLNGVMLLQGQIETTEQGLGRWLADERVYLIDTTGEEARELAAQRHANAVAGREIVVELESPFWNFDW